MSTQIPHAGPLLDVSGLTVDFRTLAGPVRAVHGVDLAVMPGEVVGLVGESGCGKTQTCLSISRLIHPSGRIGGRHILFEGTDLLQLGEREMRRLRGARISMVFQEPMSSLNPCLSIGEQLSEPLVLHQGMDWRQAGRHAAEMLGRVGIPEAKQRCREYPHQLSGGMRQRAMIAMALICRPKLLLADEPTTALDVTVQAQILALMLELREQTGAAVLLVTHNLGVVAQSCDRIYVMYAGQVVEEGTTAAIFGRPEHPYTRGLMRSVPRLRPPAGSPDRLESIPGTVPRLDTPLPGCRFHPRCAYAEPRCSSEPPEVRAVEPGHLSRCHFAGQLDHGGAPR